MMDNTEIMVLIGGVLLIAFTLWFFFGARDDEASFNGQRAVGGGALYACPMHPWITSSEPTANCSICGMKLVRIDEVETSDKVETSKKEHTPKDSSQSSHTSQPGHTHHH